MNSSFNSYSRSISNKTGISSDEKDKELSKNGTYVRVIVRCRPLSDLERKDPTQISVVSTKVDSREVCVSQIIPGRRNDNYTKTFTFDGVCNQYTTQLELFDLYIVPIVEEVLLGFNCTIFAYGQTGTGKTYTMEGDIYSKVTPIVNQYYSTNNSVNEKSLDDITINSKVATNHSTINYPTGSHFNAGKMNAFMCDLTMQAGIIPRAVQHIFQKLEAQDTEYSVRVSYLEIYNEELNDLLNDGEKQNLRIYEDTSSKKGLSVDRLEEVPVNNPQDILNILSFAVKKRRTAETLLNRQSSRSHCIFSIIIHMKEVNIEGEDVIKIGKLNLVDLAGSENIQRSGANTIKDRAKEAGMINQSLLTLGRVINALVDHCSYIPYRDSKLTRLLQESLGGRTKTCIVATISPSSLCLEETLSTLDYAFRAKNIRNKPEVNQKMTKRVMIRELNQEIERLKIELQANREKCGVYLPYERYVELDTKLSCQTNELSDLSSEMVKLKGDLDTANHDIVIFKEQLAKEKNTNEKMTSINLKLEKGFQECSNELKSVKSELASQIKDNVTLKEYEKKLISQVIELQITLDNALRNIDLHKETLSKIQSDFVILGNEVQNFVQIQFPQYTTYFDELINTTTREIGDASSKIIQDIDDCSNLNSSIIENIHKISISLVDQSKNAINNMDSSIQNIMLFLKTEFSRLSGVVTEERELLDTLIRNISLELDRKVDLVMNTSKKGCNLLNNEVDNINMSFYDVQHSMKNSLTNLSKNFTENDIHLSTAITNLKSNNGNVLSTIEMFMDTVGRKIETDIDKVKSSINEMTQEMMHNYKNLMSTYTAKLNNEYSEIQKNTSHILNLSKSQIKEANILSLNSVQDELTNQVDSITSELKSLKNTVSNLDNDIVKTCLQNKLDFTNHIQKEKEIIDNSFENSLSNNIASLPIAIENKIYSLYDSEKNILSNLYKDQELSLLNINNSVSGGKIYFNRISSNIQNWETVFNDNKRHIHNLFINIRDDIHHWNDISLQSMDDGIKQLPSLLVPESLKLIPTESLVNTHFKESEVDLYSDYTLCNQINSGNTSIELSLDNQSFDDTSKQIFHLENNKIQHDESPTVIELNQSKDISSPRSTVSACVHSSRCLKDEITDLHANQLKSQSKLRERRSSSVTRSVNLATRLKQGKSSTVFRNSSISDKKMNPNVVRNRRDQQFFS